MIPIDNFILDLYRSLSFFKPETTLVLTFASAIIFDLIFKRYKNTAAIVALIGFAITATFLLCPCCCQSTCAGNATGSTLFSGMVASDPFSHFFKLLILATSAIIVIMSFFSKELYKEDRSVGEYYILIIGMTFGMFLLCSSVNLIMVYLSIELMSLSSYVLAGYTKEINRSSEASLKYVIYGAVSSGLMIYGISILFGLTGSLNLFEINQFLAHNQVNMLALGLSSMFIIAGIGYKISAVPFHFWTPDVYEGAPITITAFLSVASKAAGFAILIRFLKITFLDTNAIGNTQVWTLLHGIDWKFVIAVLSVLSMTLGNLIAIWQDNIKRLLAYSSIAHAGYMLMAVVVMTDFGVFAVMVYFVAYLLMNLGAFYITMLFANKINSENLEDFTGIGFRSPGMGICMIIFLLSLAGIPATVGFTGKYLLFAAVIESHYIWLALIGILNSVVSLYYYAKIFRNMFLRGMDKVREPLHISIPSQIVGYILAFLVIFYGLYWTPVLSWAKSSFVLFMK